jgi:diguanylate cyclase (GGDEF)-like protein
MTTRYAPTIRSRLLLLVMACVLPTVPMIAGLIVYNYYQGRDALTQAAMGTARAMMSAVDRELAGMQAAMLVLSMSPSLAYDDLASFYEQAQQVLKTQNTSSIFLIDATLEQRVNTLRPFGSKPPPRVASGLGAVFSSRRPITTDVFMGPISRVPLIVVGVPVFRGDTVIYALGAAILPERLSALLAQQRLSPDWISAIFDSTGTVVARSRQQERFVGTKGAAAVVARIAAVREDILEATSLEGIPVLTVFSKSAVSNWSVAIGIPLGSLTRDLWSALGWIAGGSVVLLLSSLGMAWLIGFKIAQPIRQLAAPALALGSAKAVIVPFLNLKEADDVGQALTRASQMLMAAQHRANHDVLTGLANRALFAEILSHQLAICNRTKTNLAILYVDLNGFKPVNDAHGHGTGDELLCMVAMRLKGAIRESDLAARVGGDEFALILIHTGLAAAQAVAGKLRDSLSASYCIGSLVLKISASIGIAVYPESGRTSEALSQHADAEMYRAKARARGNTNLAIVN